MILASGERQHLAFYDGFYHLNSKKYLITTVFKDVIILNFSLNLKIVNENTDLIEYACNIKNVIVKWNGIFISLVYLLEKYLFNKFIDRDITT